MSEEKKKDKKADETNKTEEIMAPAILGEKVGMTQLFDDAGNVVSVTVIEAGPCVVTQVKTTAADGYNAIQVGFGIARRTNKPLKGHLKGAKARFLREMRVDNPEQFKLGQEIKVGMFKTDDFVSVSGVTIGKGFAGTVKRHHYGRGPMTHGSKSHRIPGSIGAGTTPGRVFKGKGMPGRMGGSKATLKNLRVVKVELEKNLLMLHGSVPGKRGNLVTIRKG